MKLHINNDSINYFVKQFWKLWTCKFFCCCSANFDVILYVYEDVNTRKWFNITLSVLRYSLIEFQNNFSCQHDWQIEQDGIREKFEAVPIHILSDAFPTITIVDAKAP